MENHEQDRYHPRAGFSWFLGLLVAVPILLALIAYIWTLGSVVVFDPYHQLSSVALQNSGTRVEVPRLPGGLYASTATIEGEAVFRCGNSTEVSLGYITAAVHHWRIIHEGQCVSLIRTARE